MRSKTILMLIVLSSMMTANAYVPLTREGVRWVEVYWHDQWNYEDEHNVSLYRWVYEFAGDTVLSNQTQYKKLYSYPLNKVGHFNPQQYEPVAFLRETDHKVMMPWQYTSGSEIMLYDFDNPANAYSLSDEPDWFLNLAPADSIVIDDQICAAWTFDYSFVGNIIIEGIGYVGMQGDLIDYPQTLMYNAFADTRVGLSHALNSDNKVIYIGPLYKLLFNVDGNGAVDGGDVNAEIDAILGIDDTYAGRADINEDGSVDAVDLNMLIEVVLY